MFSNVSSLRCSTVVESGPHCTKVTNTHSNNIGYLVLEQSLISKASAVSAKLLTQTADEGGSAPTLYPNHSVSALSLEAEDKGTLTVKLVSIILEIATMHLLVYCLAPLYLNRLSKEAVELLTQTNNNRLHSVSIIRMFALGVSYKNVGERTNPSVWTQIVLILLWCRGEVKGRQAHKVQLWIEICCH